MRANELPLKIVGRPELRLAHAGVESTPADLGAL
jgi:hypothetical protein